MKCFRSPLAALLPHDATARQRNGWPSLTTMRGFLLLRFPHPQQRGNMRAPSVSIFRFSLTAPGDPASITSPFGICAVFPRQPVGDPVITAHCLTHLLILVPFASNCTSCINSSGSGAKEAGQIYTHDICLRLAQTVAYPHQVDGTNRSFIGAPSPNNGSNNGGDVSQLPAREICDEISDRKHLEASPVTRMQRPHAQTHVRIQLRALLYFLE